MVSLGQWQICERPNNVGWAANGAVSVLQKLRRSLQREDGIDNVDQRGQSSSRPVLASALAATILHAGLRHELLADRKEATRLHLVSKKSLDSNLILTSDFH